MNINDSIYLGALNHVLLSGKQRIDRTGTGTTSLFGQQMRFDLTPTFPLLTSKKVHWPSVVHELLWFLKGDTNIKYLNDNGVKIWDAWADENGDLGPVYGAQWRDWECPGIGLRIDQIADLVYNLQHDPFSRRHIVSAWNPVVLPDPDDSPQANASRGLQALPPCHTMFQFYVEELTVEERMEMAPQYGFKFGPTEDGHLNADAVSKAMDIAGVPRLGLSCQLYQRSADMFLGVPFNIASYSLLTHLVAKTVGMHPMEFVWSGGDCHIYSNHVAQVNEQLDRREAAPESPRIWIRNKRDRLEDYTFDDIELIDYNPMPAIKAPISV